jgi:ketosteroid isomerase-like protein
MSHHESGHHRASDANADVIRRSFDAWQAGDVETAAALLADDIEWHEIGRAEPIRGKAALAARFQEPEAQTWQITAESHDVIANDDHVVQLVSAHATRGDGATLDYRTAEIFHVKNGQITARWAFGEDTAAINHFFGGF